MKQTNHVKNYKPKTKDNRPGKSIKLKDCISKFGIPKEPTFKQNMILEWIAKWS